MTTNTQSQPSFADFEALEHATIAPKNKKQVITDRLMSGEPIPEAPALKENHKHGRVIADSFEEYLNSDKYYSTGSIAKLVMGTPLDFQYDIEQGVKQELEKHKDRSHFDLGTFVHECILEPEKWRMVVCEPQANRASHAGCDSLVDFWSAIIDADAKMCPGSEAKLDEKKAWIEAAKIESGLRCVEFKHAIAVQAIAERWKENKIWAEALSKAVKEVSVYCNDYNGLPMRVRPDGLLFANQIGTNAIISVKTTSATTPDQFRRQFYNFGYHLKEAAYQAIVSKVTGIKFDTTIMIVLSTAEPFHTGVFILDNNSTEGALDMFNAGVSKAELALKVGDYPGWAMYGNIAGLIEMTPEITEQINS